MLLEILFLFSGFNWIRSVAVLVVWRGVGWGMGGSRGILISDAGSFCEQWLRAPSGFASAPRGSTSSPAGFLLSNQPPVGQVGSPPLSPSVQRHLCISERRLCHFGCETKATDAKTHELLN